MSVAPPLFVIGCMRSGTTVIHEMLSRYFPAAVDIETSDFEGRVFWQERGFNIGSPRTGTRCDACNGATVTDEQKREMRRHLKRREGVDRHIINKNPHLCNKIGLVNTIFPEARFVHLVRDDLAVAASTKLRFVAAYEGQNFHGVPFVHHWPNEATWPCWSCVSVGPLPAIRQPLARRLRQLIQGPRTPVSPHEDLVEFQRRHPDPSRYYPGAGFRRIPESWLRLNANIIRQVEIAGIGDRYLPLNYADLVGQTREALARIAAFAGITRTVKDAVPSSLDESRQQRWREDLTKEEQRCVVDVTDEFSVDASLIRERLPGPLFSSR